jgi:hypothetical protein
VLRLVHRLLDHLRDVAPVEGRRILRHGARAGCQDAGQEHGKPQHRNHEITPEG